MDKLYGPKGDTQWSGPNSWKTVSSNMVQDHFAVNDIDIETHFTDIDHTLHYITLHYSHLADALIQSDVH